MLLATPTSSLDILREQDDTQIFIFIAPFLVSSRQATFAKEYLWLFFGGGIVESVTLSIILDIYHERNRKLIDDRSNITAGSVLNPRYVLDFLGFWAAYT